MIGVLWNALADYHVRQGNFERVRLYLCIALLATYEVSLCSCPAGSHSDCLRYILFIFDDSTFFSFATLSSQARDVYEEAIQTVPTVRDFSQVFEAYAEV
jgi:hypothetical protein